MGLFKSKPEPEYPVGAKAIVEKRQRDGKILFELHEYFETYNCFRWMNITWNLEPDKQKDSYPTEQALRTAMLQQKKRKEAEEVVSEKILEVIDEV